MNEQLPQPEARLFSPGREDVTVSILAGSVYYFLDFVFVLAQKERYRLVVIHNNELLTYKIYNSARGARIAFNRFYGYKACEGKVNTDWSAFYPPAPEWQKKIGKIIRNDLP